MSVFEDYKFVPSEFSGVVRLFPIPNFVLFPHVMQPLHVFEPRYRDLLEDAMQSDRLIAPAILAPGWEADYDGCPRLRPYACLGKVAISQPLGDGTHNLLLAGLRRVRLLEELPPRKTYREARVMVCEDIYPPNQADERQELKRNLYDYLSRLLPRLPQGREQMELLLNSRITLGVLTDVLSYSLELSQADRETLLSEANVHRRAELLLGHLADVERGGQYTATSGLVCFPPEFSPN